MSGGGKRDYISPQPPALTQPIERAPSLNQDAGTAGFRAAAATHSTPIFMTLHTLFSTVSYCSVLWFIICSTTARTKTENIGSEQKKNEEKQPIIFYLIVYLSFPFCDVFIFLYPTYFCFFSYLISYLRPISSSKITSTYRFR